MKDGRDEQSQPAALRLNMRCKMQSSAVPRAALQHACSVRGVRHGVGCRRQGTGIRNCLEVTPWLRSERCTKAHHLMSARLSPLAVLPTMTVRSGYAHNLTQEQRTSAQREIGTSGEESVHSCSFSCMRGMHEVGRKSSWFGILSNDRGSHERRRIRNRKQSGRPGLDPKLAWRRDPQ